MKLSRWRPLKSKIVFNNRWVRIRQDRVRLPDGSVIDDYFVRETSEVAVGLAITSSGKVIIIRHYLHGAGTFITDLPAGIVEKGETPRQTMVRELLEETGYRAGKIKEIGSAYAEPTGSNTFGHYFLITGCVKVSEPLDDPRELMDVKLVTIAQLKRMVTKSEINCQFCLSAILHGLIIVGGLGA